MRQAVYDARIALPGLHEGRVWPAGSLRTAWETALTRAKIEDFHWHDTRHHFASWFVMRGGSIQALKEILGHATLAMTMRYAHLAPGHLRAEMMKTEQTSLVADRSADDARISPSLDVSACRAVSSVGRAPDF